jgi:hypothetical protein
MSGALRRFAALDQGALIGTNDWTGSILAAHAMVVNILREDGLVVSLVADPGDMTAMSVRVPGYFNGPTADIVPGDSAVGREQRIEIAGLACIDLAQSRPWNGTVDATLVSRLRAADISALREALLRVGKAGGLLGILSAGKRTNPFVEAARAALAGQRLEALVGLGPGLTPSGDDFLAGALMASAGLPGPGRIQQALSDTTPGGRTLLWAALRRSFPAYLAAFAEALSRSASTREIDDAVGAACRHGETSGTDALTGFCWALTLAT